MPKGSPSSPQRVSSTRRRLRTTPSASSSGGYSTSRSTATRRRTLSRSPTRLERIDRELVPWTPLVADVIDAPVRATQEADDLQPAFRRARLHGVVETVLGELLEPPTLLLFEDVHWMDEASSDLLRHLGSRVAEQALARLRDPPPRGRRLRRGGGQPAGAGDVAPARPPARGRCARARTRRGSGRAAARRAGRDHRARRRQPALRTGARRSHSQLRTGARGAARERRGRRHEPDRQPRALRTERCCGGPPSLARASRASSWRACSRAIPTRRSTPSPGIAWRSSSSATRTPPAPSTSAMP